MSSSRRVQPIDELVCYLVGGAVRDQLLGVEENSDRDWVVIGATPEIMLSLGFKEIGKEFPVYLHPETKEEYALARTERKSGRGYKGFVVDTSSDVTLEQDLHRRDLTVNAMAIASDQTLIDPYGGKSDLESGLLRHVSEHFVEDPLRVFRVARFAARFYSRGFIVHDSTMELMSEIADTGELNDLASERVWQEVRSALNERNPSIFFKILHICGALAQLFPELEKLYSGTDSATASKVFDELDRAACMTTNFHHRFSVVVYLVGRQAVAKKSAYTGDEKAAAVDVVRTFCARLTVPSDLRRLSLQIVQYTDEVARAKSLTAEQLVQLVRGLDGIRNQSRFQRFLEACSTVLKSTSDNTEDVNSCVELLKASRIRMSEVDAQALSEIYPPNEIGEQVRLAEIAVVKQLIDSRGESEK